MMMVIKTIDKETVFIPNNALFKAYIDSNNEGQIVVWHNGSVITFKVPTSVVKNIEDLPFDLPFKEL